MGGGGDESLWPKERSLACILEEDTGWGDMVSGSDGGMSVAGLSVGVPWRGAQMPQ